jgi:hypothetical protein
MKKLNALNKIYLAVLALLIIATGLKFWNYGSWNRYHYTASLTAPAMHPIQVMDADFILSDKNTVSLATYSVNERRQDWGWGDINGRDEYERLPVKLFLSYASYRDQAFYRDTLDLPVALIDSIFKNSRKLENEESVDEQGENERTLDFVVGIANKGNVVVWLRGKKFEQVLLKHKIIAREPLASDLYYKKEKLNKKEYLENVFKYFGEDFLKKMADGVDKDANYIDSASHYNR